MKYTLRYILENRYDPNRSKERKISERFVPFNVIIKLLSPYPTYVFLNLGIRPDWVTFLSFFFIMGGALFFIAGNAFYGAIAILLFGLLDSVDGDMARVSGTTSYGALLDSFGADLFYALIPVSLGFYLYSVSISIGSLDMSLTLLVGAFVSISFLFYRVLNTKILNFFWDKQGKNSGSVFEDGEGKQLNAPLLVRAAKLYRHRILRDNFFSEPGIILLFSSLIFSGQVEFLGIYLVVILIYNLGYIIPNFIRIYLSFLRYERSSL